MRCPEIEVLERHVSGALDASTSQSIEGHIGACDSCRELSHDIRENLLDLDNVRAGLWSEKTPPESAAPLRVGPFQIVREIGRGGMGVVYLAHQEKPQREIALKILRPGMISAETLRRFEHEVDALGRLRHPGIAAIHSAGVARWGSDPLAEQVPYFAMEYVRGKRLDLYLRDSNPGLRDRMDLLARIADAVHHAHIHGIVHRDLKPGNIHVEPSGARGDSGSGAETVIPKILDFGVARAIGPDRLAETVRTSAGQIMGTVPYMSPEQLGGDSSAVDARSDVYALGVIAYQSLAGEMPLGLEDKSLAEVARIVCEEEPRPLGRLDARFRGDIEAIVAKALAKEPGRRYQSASEFAADLRRYLANAPIVARPPSTAYHLGKIVRRNRLPFALASGLALAMIAFVVAMAILSQRARQAEGRAVIHAQSAEQMLDFVLGMFSEATPGQRNPAEVSARELIDRAAERIPELGKEPEVRARMMYSLAAVYRGLGLFERSRTLLEESLEIRRHTLGDDHVAVGMTEGALGDILQRTGEWDEAERRLRLSADILRAAKGEKSDMHAESLQKLGNFLHGRGRYDESLALQRQAFQTLRETLGPKHLRVGTSAGNLGTVLVQIGQFEEAEQLFREALAIHRESQGDRHPEVAKLLFNIGAIMLKTGRLVEAEALFRESLQIRREILGDRHPDVATQLHNLALGLMEQGRVPEAEPLLREALAIREDAIPEHWMTAETRSVLGQALASLGRRAEAETLLEGAAARIAEIRGADDEYAVRAMRRLDELRR